MFDDIMKMTDGYKSSHHFQCPKDINRVYSYLEARRGGEYPEVTFFGLQYILKRYFSGVRVTQEKIDQSYSFFHAYFGNPDIFNKKGWEHILHKHGGKLPVVIKAVPEGTIVPEGNVLLTIENTCPECFWLTNYLETLLVQIWYGITTCTISREMKKIIWEALKKSGTATLENLLFRLHDFGYRGVSSPESAAIGGAAHLVNFFGTDTLAACELLMEYYNSLMPGFSIPAAEHFTITSWGENGEVDAFKNMLVQFPKGTVAVVSDSWDIYRAVRDIWGDKLRDKVMERDGVLVIRPDSGDPHIVLPAILDILGEKFGFTINTKGYKVLPDKIRLIQGDGITRHTLAGILDAVMNASWSADCLSFGSGGGLLQDPNRDTQRMAMKCSWVEIDGIPHDVSKRPLTDPTKNSKKGRLKLVDLNGQLITVPESDPGEDILRIVFKDGELIVDDNLENIRARAGQYFSATL